MHILKKILRYSECPHPVHKPSRGEIHCYNSEKRKGKMGLKDVEMIETSGDGIILGIKGAAKVLNSDG